MHRFGGEDDDGDDDDDDDDLIEDLGGGDDGWHNGPAPLHQVVQVPGGKKYTSLQRTNR